MTWHDDGACAIICTHRIGGEPKEWVCAKCEAHHNLFFPPGTGDAENRKGGRPVVRHGNRDPYAAGQALCNDCPVKQQCLTAALAEEPNESRRYGLRGGLTPDQRTALVRKARRDSSNDYGVTIPARGYELGHITIDNTIARKELHAKGLSDVQCGHLLGIATSSFREWRLRKGLPANAGSEHRKAIHETRLDMWRNGEIDRDIGDATGATRSAITKWRRIYKLEANDRSVG